MDPTRRLAPAHTREQFSARHEDPGGRCRKRYWLPPKRFGAGHPCLDLNVDHTKEASAVRPAVAAFGAQAPDLGRFSTSRCRRPVRGEHARMPHHRTRPRLDRVAATEAFQHVACQGINLHGGSRSPGNTIPAAVFQTRCTENSGSPMLDPAGERVNTCARLESKLFSPRRTIRSAAQDEGGDRALYKFERMDLRSRRIPAGSRRSM